MKLCPSCEGTLLRDGDCPRCQSWAWGREQRRRDWALNFQSFSCHACGAPVWLLGTSGDAPARTRDYGHGVRLEIPTSFPVPTCTACGETFASLDWTLPLDDFLLRMYALRQAPRLVEFALGCPQCGESCALDGEPAPTYTCRCGFTTHTLDDLKRVGIRGPDAHGFPRVPKKKKGQPTGRRTLRLRGGGAP